MPSLPSALEVGARWAFVSGGAVGADRDAHEAGGVANWYFAGHKNKVTLDVFLVDSWDRLVGADRWRVRAQWDISV